MGKGECWGAVSAPVQSYCEACGEHWCPDAQEFQCEETCPRYWEDQMAKAFEFTFTIRSYGSSVDHAFQELQQELTTDLGALFSGLIDYEEVDKELCKKEANELMTEYAEETILETMDPAEA